MTEMIDSRVALGGEPIDPVLIDVKEVARILSLGVRTVWKVVDRDPTFPKPRTRRPTRWVRARVIEWAVGSEGA